MFLRYVVPCFATIDEIPCTAEMDQDRLLLSLGTADSLEDGLCQWWVKGCSAVDNDSVCGRQRCDFVEFFESAMDNGDVS